MDLVIKEVEVMAQRGWVDMLNTIPFYPTRFQPNGTVLRKHEPDRPMCYTNFGAPFASSESLDSGGVPVVSINATVLAREATEHEPPSGVSTDTAHTGSGGDAADAPTGQRPKWPKEQKPEAARKYTTLGILHFAVKVFGTECYGESIGVFRFFFF